MGSAGDWGDVIDEVEAKRFVGREQELESFRQQISLAKPRYLIFYITGQGGAGKSTLLHRYQNIAEGYGFLVAECDQQQRDIPAVLGHFAQQLTEQGYPLKDFNERYKTYQEKRHEIESDTEAPQSIAAMLTRTAFIVGDAVPMVRKGLEYVPREAVETQISEWTKYLAKKFINRDERELAGNPVSILTPLFFEDLNKIADKSKVLLCFDNFEATRSELQDWLLRLREYRPSLNVRIAIAGRDTPGGNWESLKNVTQTIHIDIFTEAEAEAFLNIYNVTDPKRRQEILELSGRFPVVMGLLAAAGEGEDIDVSLPTHDIVERFLRWINDPSLEQVALLAAIPRAFNADILKLLLQGQEPARDEQTAFDWLQSRTFVQQRSEGWYYHEIARRMMLHYQRQKSPQGYRQLHTILVQFYDTLRNATQKGGEEQWISEEWQKHTLAYTYHLLASNPQRHWEEIMSLFAIAVRKRRSFALDMVELLDAEDVHDELVQQQKDTIQLLHQQLQVIKDDNLNAGFEMFDKLCRMNGLSAEAKGYILAYRGECYRLGDDFKKALSDFEEALHFIPEDAWTFAGRGETHREMGHYQEALADFDHALTLDERNEWAFTGRGLTHRLLEHYREALADFDRALTLNDKDEWAFAHRGLTHRLLGRYQEALADFDRALTLDDKDELAFASRGEAHLLLGHYQEALADFDRALTLDDKDEWALTGRGLTYRLLGRYQEALADFESVLALDDKNELAFAGRGETHLLLGHYQEALADFDRALTLDDTSVVTIASRGETHRLLGHYQEALADFDRALTLDNKDELAFASRGETHRLLGHYQEALADFDRALTLDDNDEWAFAHRGETHLLLGHYQEALADFDRALTLDNQYVWAFAHRGETYRLLGRYQEALADFDHALTLDDTSAWTIASRGQTQLALEHYQEALADFDRALALDDTSAWIFDERGETHRLLEHYQEALADFDRALTLDDKDEWALTGRGLTYRLLGRYQEALADFESVLALDDTSAWIFTNRGKINLLMKNYQDALTDFNRAISLDDKYDWAISNRGQTYYLMGRYDEALKEFNRAITLDQRDDWYRYLRARIHLYTGQATAFDSDIQTAIMLGEATLQSKPNNWQYSFNLALYNLAGGNVGEAELQYSPLISACPSLPRLQEAIDDLTDLLTIQPTNELAQQIHAKLQNRIAELRQAPSGQKEETTP